MVFKAMGWFGLTYREGVDAEEKEAAPRLVISECGSFGA